ncbi:hypothetical protein E4U41_006716 [Claviceps citrina]|nr:hypothetical protein E4U41_006716 [Claviceps citrina]
MNPLESNLTARPFHKRSRSSITTASSAFDGKRHSTSEAQRNVFGFESGTGSKAPHVPFLHTREGSGSSVRSGVSCIDSPKRHYQRLIDNSSQGSFQAASNKRHSTPISPKPGAYSELPNSDQILQQQQSSITEIRQTRLSQPTGTLLPEDSVLSRTKHRGYNTTEPAATSHKENCNKTVYNPLAQTLKDGNLHDSDHEDEHGVAYDRRRGLRPANRERHVLQGKKGEALSIKSNSQDIADKTNGSQRTWKSHKDSFVQLDDGFYSKPYGDLRCATPPILLGGGRKISSGVDFGMGNRRNVSGKIAKAAREYR